jgi:hypothetical protein
LLLSQTSPLGQDSVVRQPVMQLFPTQICERPQLLSDMQPGMHLFAELQYDPDGQLPFVGHISGSASQPDAPQICVAVQTAPHRWQFFGSTAVSVQAWPQ